MCYCHFIGCAGQKPCQQQLINQVVLELRRPDVSLRQTVAPLARAQELCENRGGRPGLPVPGSPSLIVLTVSVDIKQH